MLSLSSLLFSDTFFWMLRVSPITGALPQPLSAVRAASRNPSGICLRVGK